MKQATAGFLQQLETLCEKRRHEIRSAPDAVRITGDTYYVSSSGDDKNDGRSMDAPWKTLARVSEAKLQPGDGVLFRRGDLFRGCVQTCAGVIYGAYGQGEKPKLYGWDKNLGDPALWEAWDREKHIWRLREKILDCGTLVFNGGERHSRKLIPSYIGGRFVCRGEETKVFDLRRDMTQDLDLFCRYDAVLTEEPSKGESFPIPAMNAQSLGELYLRCDAGNPGSVFQDIEALPRREMFCVGKNENVHIDNLCLKYIGTHAVAGKRHVKGLHVSNCEIGWVGGTVQHYRGTDPNYPQGGRGTVTRFGNGVEIYGGCEDCRVENCYIYQVYDAGITHQITTNGSAFTLRGILYADNLIERCVYGIEYFLNKTEGDTQSVIENCEMRGNIVRFSGYGWGQQRHNTHTPAHIKGWSFENTAREFVICDNIFDRAACRMVHLVAKEISSCPQMLRNTYVQHLSKTLGQYGANAEKEPDVLPFDSRAAEYIRDVFGDAGARVYYIDQTEG